MVHTIHYYNIDTNTIVYSTNNGIIILTGSCYLCTNYFISVNYQEAQFFATVNALQQFDFFGRAINFHSL